MAEKKKDKLSIFHFNANELPEGTKDLWGPFYETPRGGPPPYQVFANGIPDLAAAPFTYRQTVDPNTQGGFERTWRTIADAVSPDNFAKAVGNTPDTLYDIPGQAWNWYTDAISPFTNKALETIKPVKENLMAWGTKTEPEYRTWKNERAATNRVLSAPAPQGAPFSPTGEFNPTNFVNFMRPRESNLPTDRNTASSAAGPHQFIESTWLGTLKRYGPKYGLQDYATLIQEVGPGRYTVRDPAVRKRILDLRTDERVSTAMANEHSRELNTTLTKALGRAPTNEELYVGWVLGETAAVPVLKAQPNAPIGHIVGQDVIKANPRLFPNGAATTAAQLRVALQSGGSRGGTVGVPSGGTVLASQTVPLPGPGPQMAPQIPVDFSRADQFIAGMRPPELDVEGIRKQQNDMLLAGIMQGVTSTEGNIPGMLARMAAGGFASRAQGREYERQERQRQDKELRQWQGQGLGLELSKAETRAAEANRNTEIAFRNAEGKHKYDLAIANLSKMDVSPMGTMEVTVPSPDGMSVTRQVVDIGTQVYAFRQAQGVTSGLGGGRSNGGMGDLPNDVKNKLEGYAWARQRSAMGAPGGDATFWGMMAEEIAKSPAKYDILGGDQKKYNSEIMKLAAGQGGNQEVAEINYIYHLLSEAAKNNPGGLKELLARAAGHGLVGPLVMNAGTN